MSEETTKKIAEIRWSELRYEYGLRTGVCSCGYGELFLLEDRSRSGGSQHRSMYLGYWHPELGRWVPDSVPCYITSYEEYYSLLSNLVPVAAIMSRRAAARTLDFRTVKSVRFGEREMSPFSRPCLPPETPVSAVTPGEVDPCVPLQVDYHTMQVDYHEGGTVKRYFFRGTDLEDLLRQRHRAIQRDADTFTSTNPVVLQMTAYLDPAGGAGVYCVEGMILWRPLRPVESTTEC